MKKNKISFLALPILGYILVTTIYYIIRGISEVRHFEDSNASLFFKLEFSYFLMEIVLLYLFITKVRRAYYSIILLGIFYFVMRFTFGIPFNDDTKLVLLYCILLLIFDHYYLKMNSKERKEERSVGQN